jgi:EAL domain-containing protein (putative c-di-GMP-specific phosphodiesterase class I)
MDSRKRAVIQALISMTESIAPLLIAEGVSSSEAESVLRSVCVHEAA